MNTKEQIAKVQSNDWKAGKAGNVECRESDISAFEPKSKSDPRLKEFHFNMGNSSTGAIGICAVVQATSEEAALDILKAALPEEVPVHTIEGKVIYVEVYINPDNITLRDIDETC
jgi:hypothetical protein